MQNSADLSDIFVCSRCKNSIRYENAKLICDNCGNQFDVLDGLINFTPKEYWIEEWNNTIMKKAYSIFFDLLGPIYESNIWYQWTLNISGAKGNSIKTITDYINGVLANVEGNIIDIACGTATYGRRIANEKRVVYGLDFSYGMLRQGIKYIEKQKLENIYLVQGTADYLAFKNDSFYAAICAGSLHLFNDPSSVLKEVKRVLKTDSKIALQTFISNRKDKNPSFKEKTGFHFFDSSSLEMLLKLSGFKDIETKEVGTVLFAQGIVDK